ncbi:craniofacial development protein 2-like [Mytilus trossulus]|uniref:craniofacial development protein 2-like n=1 Tax=Mytilus trossulus TaxID=6551 RepID=UPI0030074EF9
MTVISESRDEANNTRNGLLRPKSLLRVGGWNVRTMYEVGKTAQIEKEMLNYNIDILGISECRWTGYGSVITTNGQKIVYSGRKDNIHREGVAIIMNKQASKALIEWKPIDERIITARFHSKYVKLTLSQCYAPTNEADIETKTDFYEKLRSVMEGVHAHDVVLVNGDLNAKVGNDNIGVERIMGNNGCGTCNENGNLLIEFCGLNDLVIGGTLFQHKEIHKLTWTSPNRRDKNQIDHLMINGR